MNRMPRFAGADDPLALLGVGGTDYVGGVDYVGANFAPVAQGPRFSRVQPQAMQLANMVQPIQAAPRASAVHAEHVAKQEQLVRAKRLPQVLLGVDSEPQAAGGIAGGATLGITSEPSVPMRLTDFKVSAAIAPFFNIDSITIARLNLLTGASGVPAEAFIPNAENPPIEAAVLPAGSQVITSVENVDDSNHRFRGMYFGIDLTPAAARIV